jgi:hypothetical protein
MSQYEDDRTYGGNRQYYSPYDPMRRYGPGPGPRPTIYRGGDYNRIGDIASRYSMIQEGNLRVRVARLKDEVSMGWLNYKLRDMGMSGEDRTHLFSIIEEVQEQERRKERLTMTAKELIDYWNDFEGERLRFQGAYVKNGWLTDVLASNQRSKHQSYQEILVVVDGKARYFLPSTTVYVWPNYVDDEE